MRPHGVHQCHPHVSPHPHSIFSTHALIAGRYTHPTKCIPSVCSCECVCVGMVERNSYPRRCWRRAVECYLAITITWDCAALVAAADVFTCVRACACLRRCAVLYIFSSTGIFRPYARQHASGECNCLHCSWRKIGAFGVFEHDQRRERERRQCWVHCDRPVNVYKWCCNVICVCGCVCVGFRIDCDSAGKCMGVCIREIGELDSVEIGSRCSDILERCSFRAPPGICR